MRHITTLLILIFSTSIFAQNNVVKTAGVSYTAGAPTFSPGRTGSQVAIDTVTGLWYEHNGTSWSASGYRVQTISGCSAPAYTPEKYQSRLVINACSAGQGGPELYYWTGSAWLQINEGQTYTAGAGISIAGDEISADDNSPTNELQTLSIDGNDLTLSDGGGTVTLPGGESSSQNIQQTLDIGNTTTKNIVWDSIVAHPTAESGYSYNFFTVNPMDTVNQGNANGPSPLLFGISTNGGEIHSNQVFYMGWNMSPGGGALNAGRPGIGEGWEQWWRPGNGNVASKTEKHEVWIRRDGFPVRLGSYECDNSITNGNAALYHTVNRFSLRYGIQDNQDYFSIQGNAASNLSNFVLTNSTGSFSFDYNTSGDANLTLSNNKTSGTPQLNFSGFNTIGAGTIGSISVPSGFQINAADGSLLQFSSGQHRWITSGYQPIRLRPNAKNALECWANSAGNYGVNIGNILFGSETTTRFQAASETATSASYAARFFAASTSSPILSLRGDRRVGIKNDSPARDLDVNGEVRVFDLITDAPIKFVGADADGDLGEIPFYKGSATLDFPSTLAGQGSDLTVAATGSLAGYTVQIGTPASIPANSCFFAWVSAADTVTIRFNNYSASPIDPPSGTYNVVVTKY